MDRKNDVKEKSEQNEAVLKIRFALLEWFKERTKIILTDKNIDSSAYPIFERLCLANLNYSYILADEIKANRVAIKSLDEYIAELMTVTSRNRNKIEEFSVGNNIRDRKSS